MTTEQPPSRLQIAQRLAAHLGHGDFDQYIGLLSEDVTYRVGGNHALAGIFHGPDEVTAQMRAVVDLTESTFDATKWEDWLVGEHHVAAVVQIHAQGHGATVTARQLVLLRFDPADKISEITVLVDDAGSTERFVGR
jgi:ketosteroid isomerase-like protein